MIPEPRNLDEAWMQARAAVLEIRVARAAAYRALGCSDTPIEELSHGDDVYDLDCRERIVLDALSRADLHHDL